MNPDIDSWLNHTNLNVSHSPFLFGIICGSILSTSVSISSLISLRRLIIQGVPAGIVSYLGAALTETLFLGFIMFGSIKIIDYWVVLEPGLKLLITIFCYDTVLGFLVDNRLKIVSFDNKLDLLKIFFCNALIVFSNPGSISAASALLISVESFEFRENTIFLLGIFLGIFSMGIFIGFLVLGFTYLWMIRSTKSFRSLLYRFNKIISTITLSVLIISTIYYHNSIYLGVSFTNWLYPLVSSPSLKKETLNMRSSKYEYHLIEDDINSVKFLARYHFKLQDQDRKTPYRTIKQYFQNKTEQAEKKVKAWNPVNYQKKLEKREQNWYSRSPFYRSIENKLATIFNSKQEKIKFFEDSSFVDLPWSYKMPSPLSPDRKGKRILVRQITKDEFLKLQQLRENRIQDLEKNF